MDTKKLTAHEAREKSAKNQLPTILKMIELAANKGKREIITTVDIDATVVAELKELGFMYLPADDTNHTKISW
jgi:hypothetical protein